MNPETLERATGRTTMQFEQLLPRFEVLWAARYEGRTVTGESRRRRRGGGHWTVLASTRAKLFFILFYARFRPSQEVMALVFGMSQGQVSHWISRLNPVAARILGSERESASSRPVKFAELIREVPELPGIVREVSAAVRRLCPDQPSRSEKLEPRDSDRMLAFVPLDTTLDRANTRELNRRSA